MPDRPPPSDPEGSRTSPGGAWSSCYGRALRNPYLVAAVAAVVLVGVALAAPVDTLGDVDMPEILDMLRDHHSLRAVGSWFVGDWVQSNGYYRPLASLSLWLDFEIWRDKLWGYRVTNGLIVAATAVALVWLAETSMGTPWAGVLAGIVLACTADARYVMWYPATRTDALCGLFMCLATASAISYVRDGTRGRLLLSLGMFLAALWCKEVAFIWPVFVAVAGFAWGFRRRAAVLSASAFALAAVLWAARAAALGTPLTGTSIEIVNFPLAGQMWQYARFLMAPVFHHVTVSYPCTDMSLGVLLLPSVPTMVFLDLWFLAANVFVFAADLRAFCIVWAWRLITYLPSLPFAYFRPHYWYIPELGSCLLHGAAMILVLRWLAPRCRKALRAKANSSC